jgi:hypothetical protein
MASPIVKKFWLLGSRTTFFSKIKRFLFFKTKNKNENVRQGRNKIKTLTSLIQTESKNSLI